MKKFNIKIIIFLMLLLQQAALFAMSARIVPFCKKFVSAALFCGCVDAKLKDDLQKNHTQYVSQMDKLYHAVEQDCLQDKQLGPQYGKILQVPLKDMPQDDSHSCGNQKLMELPKKYHKVVHDVADEAGLDYQLQLYKTAGLGRYGAFARNTSITVNENFLDHFDRNDERMKMLLRHECTHLKRRDLQRTELFEDYLQRFQIQCDHSLILVLRAIPLTREDVLKDEQIDQACHEIDRWYEYCLSFHHVKNSPKKDLVKDFTDNFKKHLLDKKSLSKQDQRIMRKKLQDVLQVLKKDCLLSVHLNCERTADIYSGKMTQCPDCILESRPRWSDYFSCGKLFLGKFSSVTDILFPFSKEFFPYLTYSEMAKFAHGKSKQCPKHARRDKMFSDVLENGALQSGGF